MDDSDKHLALVLPFEETFPTASMSPNTDLVSSECVRILNNICWSDFERNVVEAVCKSIESYVEKPYDAALDSVYQIALCTSVQHRGTSINFETRSHAEERLSYLREKGFFAKAVENARLIYNPSQADFKFWGFYGSSHPELDPLQWLNLDDKEVVFVAESYIERSLLQVVQRLLDENILDALPHKDEIWIGISSPRDWYDHMHRIRKHGNKWMAEK